MITQVIILLQDFGILIDPGSYFRRVSFLMSRVSQEVQIFDRVEPTQCKTHGS